jgi:hypothetical protein
MKNTLIVLDSYLTMTEPAVQVLARILGPARVVKMENFNGLAGYHRLLVCCPGQPGEQFNTWLARYQAELSTTPSLLLCLEEDIPSEAPLTWPGKFTRQPRRSPPQTWIDFALAFRADDHLPNPAVPAERLRSLLEEFLLSHDTCALSTSYNGRVRATPIEYRYDDGRLYCISEGGEKFAGLLHNGRVSLAVFEPYRGFKNLAGCQLFGQAAIPVFGSDEYIKIIARWKLTVERVEQLPALLHAVDIRLEEAVMVWSKFKDEGWDIRQVYRFTP